MGFKCGIVGLPNVGKSTLFNALTQTAAAQAANYPFCTIEPNVGEVAVPDPRLDTLARIAKSAQIIPTRLTFVDIAGLVRGASKGEGLGNQFLAHIREVDAVAYVLRCFDDGDVTHVEGRIDPTADAETVETELMLADLDSLERRIVALEKKAKMGEKEAKVQAEVMNIALALLREGKPARLAKLNEGTKAGIFNRINWSRLRQAPGEALVDSNASPVLFWQPGKATETLLATSNIGSQADAMAAVSTEYEKWVKRAMNWVRRNGTRVWGLERHEVRPDLDIDLSFLNNVYALPEALIVLQNGARGRD